MNRVFLLGFVLTTSSLALWAGGQPASMANQSDAQTSPADQIGGSSTMGGAPISLVGTLPEVGEQAPDFELMNAKLEVVTLADLGAGKKIFNVVTSLDTPVCEQQTEFFSQQLAQLPGYQMFTISADLPFAQQRWASSAGVDSPLLSDYKTSSFGTAYGLLAKEVGLLNRAIIVLDEDNIVRYVQKVDEMFDHPDYEAALAAVRNI